MTTSPTPAERATLSPLEDVSDAAGSHTAEVVKRLPLLGPVAWLMLFSPATRHVALSDLEWRVMPALMLDQAKLYMREGVPLAFVTWARLSTQAAERYRKPPHQLPPADWRSGEQVWLMDVIAPFGNVADVIKDLRENVFPGQALRQLSPVGAGLAEVLSWAG